MNLSRATAKSLPQPYRSVPPLAFVATSACAMMIAPSLSITGILRNWFFGHQLHCLVQLIIGRASNEVSRHYLFDLDYDGVSLCATTLSARRGQSRAPPASWFAFSTTGIGPASRAFITCAALAAESAGWYTGSFDITSTHVLPSFFTCRPSAFGF